MKETVKEGRLYALFGKALLLSAAAFVMLYINPWIAHAASGPMGSEADGYYLDASGNMTIYTEEGLENWLDDIGGGPRTYKVLVKTLTVNEGVTVIQNFSDSMYDMPFSEDCDNLTTVSLPASLTEIGDKVFKGCGKLTTVTIAEPSNLTTIGESAFDFDTSLTTINIPASVTTIGSGAFKDCRALELDAATLPSGLTAINDSIFANCWKMTGSLTIPDGVTSIGDNAFDNCRALESVTIPASVRSIGSNAFYGCVLTSVTIPDGVTSIGASAFYYCYKLKSVTIPASVTSIGDSAFERCDTLDSVTMLGETPPTLGDGSGSDNVFKDSGISTIDKQIYVPKSSIAAYKNSWTQWKDYINDDGGSETPDPGTDPDPGPDTPGTDPSGIKGGKVEDLDPTRDKEIPTVGNEGDGDYIPAKPAYADTAIDVQAHTVSSVVYSVDVEWGAMTFRYENSLWDATAHQSQTGAGWQVYDSANDKALDTKEDAINRIQVTNHSNAEVKAALTYTGKTDYEDTTGSFAKAADDADTSYDGTALTLASADNGKGESGAGKETVGRVYFMPSGIKENYKTAGITKWTQLGTITVGIETADQAESTE